MHEHKMYTYYKDIQTENLGDCKDKIIGVLLIFIPQHLFPNSHC